MNWDDWQRAELASLRGLLRTHYSELWEARATWAKVGRTPGDPLVVGLDRSLTQTTDLGRLVADEIIALAPYRPGVSPWRTQGLRAVLRADFAARGIAGRD